MTRIRVLGDYDPTYLANRQLDAAVSRFPPGVTAGWTATDAPEAAELRGIDGLWVAPGSPYRDDGAVLAALRAARERHVPVLATCGGFQYALVELARNVAGLANAANAELEPDAPDPVVAPLVCSLFGQARSVAPIAGTRFAELVGREPFVGAHYCNYGLAARHLPRLRAAGLVEAAYAADAGLEAFELAGHPFFFATLFQPQVGASTAPALHPLIVAFVAAAQRRSAARAAS